METIEQALAPLSGAECERVIAGLETLDSLLGDGLSGNEIPETEHETASGDQDL